MREIHPEAAAATDGGGGGGGKEVLQKQNTGARVHRDAVDATYEQVDGTEPEALPARGEAAELGQVSGRIEAEPPIQRERQRHKHTHTHVRTHTHK